MPSASGLTCLCELHGGAGLVPRKTYKRLPKYVSSHEAQIGQLWEDRFDSKMCITYIQSTITLPLEESLKPMFSLYCTPLTGNIEVVSSNGIAKPGRLDEVGHVEAEPLALQHCVRGGGDLPVGRLRPEQVRVAVRVRRVLCCRSGREPCHGALRVINERC